MKLSEIARNLANEGMKFRWGKGKLITWKDEVEPAYCALGIKAREFGVPNVVLAYYDSLNPSYMHYNLMLVSHKNDSSWSREQAIAKLEASDGEVDIKGWVASLKGMKDAAIAWATRHGYHSLLVDTEFKEVEIPS